MDRAFTNILTGDVESTARFYEDLLGMERAGDFGWFVVLTQTQKPGLELGVLDKAHETLPEGVDRGPGGVVLTFVVSDLEVVHAKARTLGAEIIQEPTDLPYGQRRLLLRDPAGIAVDVSSPIR